MSLDSQIILVTGATGFVGQTLVRSLRRQGARVRTLARSGADFDLDLSTKPDLHEALRGCSAVVHLAARVHFMEETESDPTQAYHAANVEATRHLAEQALSADVSRFVFMSSIKVNGERTVGQPFSEKLDPQPEDPYGQSKLEAEKLLLSIARETSKFRVVILRPPLIYGPGVRANFAQLMRLVTQAPVLPFGLFFSKRSLIFVGNLVSAIETALSPMAPSGVYVISDGVAVSIRELSLKIARAAGHRLWLIPVPTFVLRLFAGLLGRSAQISRLTEALEVDSSGFEQTFSWKPPIALEEALKITMSSKAQK